MLSFRVFASIESRPAYSHLVGKIPTRSGHPRRFVSPPPRDLCGRRLPRPCRDVGVHPGKTIRVGLVDRRTPAHSLIGRSLRTRPVPILSGRSRPCRDWLGVSPIPRRSSHPNHSLTGRSLRPGLDLSSNASLSTFNRTSRRRRDCRLSTSSLHLPMFTSPLSATLMGSPRMCCKQKTYSNAKPFRCNTYKKTGGGWRTPNDTSSPRTWRQ